MQMVRKAAGAHAYRRIENGKYEAKSDAVLAYEWGITEHFDVVRMSRLQWYQHMAISPQNHQQYLAALLGDLPGHAAAVVDDEVTDQGREKKPWVGQLLENLEAFKAFESTWEFFHAIGRKTLRLFKETEVAE